jgi:formate hydrogenlyase subunit 4
VVAADGAAGGAPDATGRRLALAEAGDALRLMVWLMLVLALLLPPAGIPVGANLGTVMGSWLLGGLAWGVKLMALAAGAALAATLLPRPAVRQVGTWLGLAALAAVLGVLLVFAGQGRT